MAKTKKFHVEVYEKVGYWRDNPNSKAGWKRKQSFETRSKAEGAKALYRYTFGGNDKIRVVEE